MMNNSEDSDQEYKDTVSEMGGATFHPWTRLKTESIDIELSEDEQGAFGLFGGY